MRKMENQYKYFYYTTKKKILNAINQLLQNISRHKQYILLKYDICLQYGIQRTYTTDIVNYCLMLHIPDISYIEVQNQESLPMKQGNLHPRM